MYQGFTGFYPTYLIEVKGLSPSVASGLFGLFFAMGMLVQPATGVTGDRIGERRALMIVLGTSTVTLAALPFVTGFWGVVGITIALSSLLGRGVLTLTYLTNALPEDMRGTGLGILRSGYMLIAASSPILIGILADIGRFDEAFLLLAGAGGVMLLLTLVLPARG
jgi:MFS family permease